MTTFNPPIKGIASCEVVGEPDAGGLLIDCRDAAGVYLGRRHLPGITDPADLPAALAGDAVPARLPLIESAAALRARLLARLAEHRWEVETGGFVFLDRPIMSDDRSQLSILGVFTAAMADPNFSTIWKCADASWLTLDAQRCIALFQAAAGHKQACFARETVLASQIAAAGDDRAALRALEPVVESFW
jgi:hypothetical protein